jgi:urease accessory protein
MPINPPRLALTLAMTLAAGSALAHPGHDSTSFLSGFGHPLGGLDHLLAMLAVGLYAARHAGRERWLLPTCFVTALLIGTATSAMGFALPAIEVGIAASVLVLGLLVAFVARLPMAASVPLVGLFALLHGHAHHAEMGDGSLVTFAFGFTLATTLLHAVGYLIARHLPKTPVGRTARRCAGGLIAATGVVLLVA